jgi:hypothetical protein
VALVAWGAVAVPAKAEAQTAVDATQARTLFDEARRLMEDGEYPEACTKLEASNRLAPGVGTRFNLAECREREGKLATAWAIFLDVAAETKLLGDRRRERVARRRASELEPRLNRLTLRGPTSPGLELRLDERRIEPAALDTAMPIDAGEHLLTASAPSKLDYQKRIVVAGEGTSIAVEIPALVDAPAPIRAAEVAPVDARSAPRARSSAPRSPLLYGAAGVGALGIGLGTYFSIRTISARSELAGICPSGVDCRQSEVTRYRDVRSDATRSRALSIAGFSVGGAALTAVVFLLLRPHGLDEPQAGSVVVIANAAQQRLDVGVSGDW